MGLSMVGTEDEHVVLFGRQKNIYANPVEDQEDQLIVKTFTGQYEANTDNLDAWTAADAFPSLSVEKLTTALSDKKWGIESIRISHVQLKGTMFEFIKLASCLKQCNTLKSVLLCDSRTCLQTGGSIVSLQTGFDSIINALSKASNVQEVTLQNMPVSSEALAELWGSSSLEKLMVMISPSMLPTGNITGKFIAPMAKRLQFNKKLKDLRIVGVLDYEACSILTKTLQVNKVLEKLSVKVKLKPARSCHEKLPLIQAIRSSSCKVKDLELYLSGCRQDIEIYAASLTDALKYNQSLKSLNVVFYGIDLQGRGAVVATKTKQVWMELFTEVVERNFQLEQVMLNHGLVDLSDTVKFYLKLNRVGRRYLFGSLQVAGKKNNGEIVTCTGDESKTTREALVISEDDLWLEALIKLRDDVPCIHYLLANNPGFLCRINRVESE